MNKRLQSMKLMSALQPFTQMGVIRAEEAQKMIDSYLTGDTGAIKALVYNPSVPAVMQPVIEKLAQFI